MGLDVERERGEGPSPFGGKTDPQIHDLNIFAPPRFPIRSSCLYHHFRHPFVTWVSILGARAGGGGGGGGANGHFGTVS